MTTADGAELENMAKTLPAQMREGCAGDVDGAPEIRVDLAAELRRRHLLEGADEAIASIIRQHIEPSEARKGGLDRRGRLCLIRDIERDGEDAVAVMLGQRRQ
jgi:hypothetical protein